MSEFVVSAHQPNLLIGCSVATKILASDAVIWVDEVDYSHFSFTARNRLPDGTLLVVPLRAETRQGPINRVEIADQPRRWRAKLARTLEMRYGDLAQPYIDEVLRPYGLLVGLNAALLRRMCDDLGADAQWHWQSQLLGGRKLESITDDRASSGLRRQISHQLAAMTAEVGGNVYLSGPSGARYLDESPFEIRGVEVRYWHHHGPNPTALELVRDRVAA